MQSAIDELLKLGYSQIQIALGCGVTRQTIARFMKGEVISSKIHKRAAKLLLTVVHDDSFITDAEHKEKLNEKLKEFGDSL